MTGNDDFDLAAANNQIFHSARRARRGNFQTMALQPHFIKFHPPGLIEWKQGP